VGWACMLYADHHRPLEKRNGQAIQSTHPSKLDRAKLLELAQKYGRAEVVEAVRRGEGLEGDSNSTLTGGVEDVDDYFRCRIEQKQDIRDLFVPRFYFGCEADDPANAWAFNTKANPMRARLNAIFSSDIGHFDVPDMTAVVPEAYELVEHGLLTDDDFRDFMFATRCASGARWTPTSSRAPPSRRRPPRCSPSRRVGPDPAGAGGRLARGRGRGVDERELGELRPIHLDDEGDPVRIAPREVLAGVLLSGGVLHHRRRDPRAARSRGPGAGPRCTGRGCPRSTAPPGDRAGCSWP